MAPNGTVILFYKYVKVEDPEHERLTQKSWWDELNITGRMRVSAEGVNANLYGLKENIEEYKRRMEGSKYWGQIEYKHSNPIMNGGDEDPFNGMKRIRVSQEITGTGPVMNKFLPTALGGNGGTHLSPEEFDKVVKRSLESDDVVVIDTRNHYETIVGKFRNAVDPKIRCFGEFPGWIEANKEQLKDKEVALYCTGGIRCEKASAYVKSLGVAKEVYQLQGGISHYLTKYSDNCSKENGVYIDSLSDPAKFGYKSNKDPEDCVYDGVNFQFDNRYSEDSVGVGEKTEGICCYCFSKATVIACDTRCAVCSNLVLVCQNCLQHHKVDVCLSQADPEHATESKRYDPNTLTTYELYCPEHQLLGPQWEQYLDTLMEKKWTAKDLQNARKYLEKNLTVPIYIHESDWKPDRIADLKLQMERIDEYLAKHPEFASSSSESTEKHEKFLPYVPFLNP